MITMVITQDGAEKFRADFTTREAALDELLGIMHRIAPAYSAHHAFNHEGWSVAFEARRDAPPPIAQEQHT